MFLELWRRGVVCEGWTDGCDNFLITHSHDAMHGHCRTEAPPYLWPTPTPSRPSSRGRGPHNVDGLNETTADIRRLGLLLSRDTKIEDY